MFFVEKQLYSRIYHITRYNIHFCVIRKASIALQWDLGCQDNELQSCDSAYVDWHTAGNNATNPRLPERIRRRFDYRRNYSLNIQFI